MILYGNSARLNPFPLHSANACFIYAQFAAAYPLTKRSVSCLSNSSRNPISIFRRYLGFVFLHNCFENLK